MVTRIGLDFDNTIVCYDKLFFDVARERALITSETPCHKEAVRDAIRASHGDEEWSHLQGYVYGVRMGEAAPFSGVIEFLQECSERGFEPVVVSHRSKVPGFGPPYDLHSAARAWCAAQGLFTEGLLGVGGSRAYFEPTRAQKIERIRALAPCCFIDDLPEVFLEPSFPPEVKKIHFCPEGAGMEDPSVARMRAWAEAWQFLPAA